MGAAATLDGTTGTSDRRKAGNIDFLNIPRRELLNVFW